MRSSIPATILTLLVSSCGSRGGSGAVYARQADSAFSAGQWGDAMAAYDAAHDEAPADQRIIERRRDAAARWIEATAPQLATASPPEKAFALLSALAAEGHKRGADAAVERHVAAALDRVILQLWSGDVVGDDPKQLWQAVSRGEQLTQTLPDGAGAHAKLAALRHRAATVFGDLARASRHAGSAYLFAAMAARMMGARPPVVPAFDAITVFDYALTFPTPGGCPQLEAAFHAKLDALDHYFGRRAGGIPAKVTIEVNCVPLAAAATRKEDRAWVETRLEARSTTSCSTNVVQSQHAQQLVRYSRMTGEQVLIHVEPVYKTVPSCSTSHAIDTVNESKRDLVTVTTEEVGFHAAGLGGVAVAGKAYVAPISARVVVEKITTEGAVFGKKEELYFDTSGLLPMTAHTLWIEMSYLEERAHDGYAGDLLARADADGDVDAKVGGTVAAIRVRKRISDPIADGLEDRLGLDRQDLGELVLDAPHVTRAPRIAGGYTLDVPKVDRALVKAVEKQKRADGVDDFK